MSNEPMKMALAKQLTIALQNLGAPVELLCIVGSYGDTQTDSDILEMLEQYNERGTSMEVIIAPEFIWKPSSGGRPMSNIDKRALRVLATALDGDDWHAEGNGVYGGPYDVGDNVCYDHIASCESVNAESPHADFIAAANPATVLALLDELEAKDNQLSVQRDYYEGVIADGSKRISELEAREVKLPDIKNYLSDVTEPTLDRALRLTAKGVRSGDVAAIRAAGIRIKGED